jgi:DNA-binding transcriptional LysR family regulator
MDQFAELTAFVRTVDCGSQAAAGRELGITPAMVGRYIRALEDRLGARLLNRTTTRQSVTEAGALFHARAVAVLEMLDSAEAAILDRQEAPRGQLRVSAPMVFGTRYLAGWLAEFHRLNPAVQIELSLNDRRVDLVEEGYDVALRIGQLADSSLIARGLAPCRLVVCAAPSYLARRGTPNTPSELRGHDCLLYTYAAEGHVWHFVGPEGRKIAVDVAGPLAANNGDALQHAALEGAGIVMQPTFIAGDAIRAGTVVRLLPGWRVPDLSIYAVYPSTRHLAPKVRAFVDFLSSRLGDPPPWDEGL